MNIPSQIESSEMLGLKPEHLEKVMRVFRQHPDIKEVKVYGSRAKGSFRKGSDIDLAFIGVGLNHRQIIRIGRELDDLMLPYTFDLTDYGSITNKALSDHIDRAGKVLYRQ